MLASFVISSILSFGQITAVEGQGEVLAGRFARDVGLSSANLLSDLSPGAFASNPAVLGFGEGFEFNASLSVVNSSEERSALGFDDFGNTIGNIAVYSKTSSYFIPGPFSVSYGDGVKGAGLAYYSRYDFNYEYSSTGRLDSYVVDEVIRSEREGDVKDIALGLAYRFGDLGVGVVAEYLMGTVKDVYSHSFTNPSIEDTLTEESTDLKGYTGGIGVIYRAGYRAVLGLSARIQTDLKDGTELTYPKEIAFGAQLVPVAKLPTRAYLAVVYMPWENDVDEAFENVLDFRLGFEHQFLTNTYIRFGARLRNSYVREDLWLPSFSFGGGYFVDPFTLDVGVSLDPTSYDMIWEDENVDVRETAVRVVLGASGALSIF
jgi:hypothetical protein